MPRPEAYRTVLAAYDIAAGGRRRRVADHRRRACCPGAMEIMDRLAIDAAEAAVHAGYPPGAAAVLHRRARRRARAGGRRVRAADAADRGVRRRRDTRVAADAEDRARIWKGRKCAFSAVGRISPDFIVQDGVVPRTRLGEALATIEQLSRATRHARRQRVPCRRRQPAPAHPLRWPRGRRARARRGAGGRHPAAVHPAWRVDHRRARRRPREARVSPRDVRRRGHRLHAAAAPGDRLRASSPTAARCWVPATHAAHGCIRWSARVISRV